MWGTGLPESDPPACRARPASPARSGRRSRCPARCWPAPRQTRPARPRRGSARRRGAGLRLHGLNQDGLTLHVFHRCARARSRPGGRTGRDVRSWGGSRPCPPVSAACPPRAPLRTGVQRGAARLRAAPRHARDAATPVRPPVAYSAWGGRLLPLAHAPRARADATGAARCPVRPWRGRGPGPWACYVHPSQTRLLGPCRSFS